MTKYFALGFFIATLIGVGVLFALPEHEIGTKTTTEKVDFIKGTDTYTEEIIQLKEHDNKDQMYALATITFILGLLCLICLAFEE